MGQSVGDEAAAEGWVVRAGAREVFSRPGQAQERYGGTRAPGQQPDQHHRPLSRVSAHPITQYPTAKAGLTATGAIPSPPSWTAVWTTTRRAARRGGITRASPIGGRRRPPLCCAATSACRPLARTSRTALGTPAGPHGGPRARPRPERPGRRPPPVEHARVVAPKHLGLAYTVQARHRIAPAGHQPLGVDGIDRGVRDRVARRASIRAARDRRNGAEGSGVLG